MKLIKIIIILLFVLTSIGLGQTIINAIPAPSYTSGLCWDGAYLWCGRYGTSVSDSLYKINPANGAVVKMIRWRPAGWTSGACYGLAFDTANGGSLWVSTQVSGTPTPNDTIFLIDTINGSRIRALRARKEYMAGLANDGQHLWHCVYYSPDGGIYKINKNTGDSIDFINIPTIPQPWSTTWDGQYLWVGNDSSGSGGTGGRSRIYKIDVVLKQIVDSINSPSRRPRGLAWDGNYLWVAAMMASSPTGWGIYQIDLGGGGTPVISISPNAFDFGNVAIGQSPYFQLTVSNIGTDTLRIDTFFISNTAFSHQVISFPVFIAPSSAISYWVYFTPTAFQLYTGNLGIVSNDPVRETVYVSLRGQGVYPNPTLSPNATSYDFGSIGINCVKDWFLRIVNHGYLPLVIDSIKYSNNQFFNLPMNLPISLNCLETTFIQVISRPQNYGNYSGNMEIYSNAVPNPFIIMLNANGIVNAMVGGQLLWEYEFPDNVVCVSLIDDINGDSICDVAAESYGTEMYGKKHLRTFCGNSFGNGVVQWQVGDNDFTGSWGDDCLIMGDDYNNDSINDILLATAWGDRSVYALNGVNGQIIWYYDSHWYDNEGGWVYSVRPMPDITGDGIGEVLAGIGTNQTAGGGPRSMYCFNGANGNIIWQFRIGDAVGTVNWINDVNNDGVVDAICGAWGNSYDMKVYCVSGASSGLVTTPIWQYQCGGDVQSVVTIPDLNGDGKDEVVAGAWNGMVYCLSGANGSPIWTANVGGYVVKLVLIPDLIAVNRPGIAVCNVNNVIAFNVLNCLNGSVYWNYLTNSNTWSADVIDDLDNDGKKDVIFGTQNGFVYCVSGANGNLLWHYSAGQLVYSIRAISDVSFDNYPDVLVGLQRSSSTGIGKVLAICGGHFPGSITETEDKAKSISKVYISPNPAKSIIRIHYSLTENSRISLKLYNTNGQLIENLVDNYVKAGQYVINYPTYKLAKGVYIINFATENYTNNLKLVIR